MCFALHCCARTLRDACVCGAYVIFYLAALGALAALMRAAPRLAPITLISTLAITAATHAWRSRSIAWTIVTLVLAFVAARIAHKQLDTVDDALWPDTESL